jgi:hypothetical protein
MEASGPLWGTLNFEGYFYLYFNAYTFYFMPAFPIAKCPENWTTLSGEGT